MSNDLSSKYGEHAHAAFKAAAWKAFLFLGFAALYAATKGASHEFDSVWLSMRVEREIAAELLHPHHLLHLPLIWLIWRGMASLGLELRALEVTQLVNAVAAAGALVLFRRVLFAIRPSLLFSFAAATLYGFTGGFWHQATDGQSYPVAVLVSLSCLYYGIAREGRRAAIASGLLGGLAFCFHELSSFIVIIPLMRWLLSRDRENRLSRIGWFLAGSAGLAFTAYASTLVYLRRLTREAIFRWIWDYPTCMPHCTDIAEKPFLKASQGLGKSFVFLPNRFLPFHAVLLLGLLVVGYFGYCWFKQRDALPNAILVPLAVSTALSSAFAFWWTPENHTFWVFPFCSGLLLLFSVACARRLTLVTFCAALAFFLANFGLHVCWRTDPENNPRRPALAAVSQVDKNAWLVFLSRDPGLRHYITYFGQYRYCCEAEQFFRSISLPNLKDALERGQPVYFYLSAADRQKLRARTASNEQLDWERQFWRMFSLSDEPQFPMPGNCGLYPLTLVEKSD